MPLASLATAKAKADRYHAPDGAERHRRPGL